MKNFTSDSLKKELSLQVQSMKKESSIRSKNTFRKLMKGVLALIMFLMTSMQVNASHVMGADLTYKLINSNAFSYTYLITLTLYRDCSGISFQNDECLITGGNYLDEAIPMTTVSFTDVTPICKPPEFPYTPATNCPSGAPVAPDYLKGCQRKIMTGTITLPKNTGSYIFSYRECCRNNVNTIVGQPELYTQCVLSTDNGYANSSPVFTYPPIPYWCSQTKQTYSHGAVDSFDNPMITINGITVVRDSLAYNLYVPWFAGNPSLPLRVKGQNSSVTMLSPLNGVNFLHTAPGTGGVIVDPKTGTITCTPDRVETAIMAMKIDEYRAIPAPGGYTRVNIGHVVRDIQFTIGKSCGLINNVGTLEDSAIGTNVTSFDEIDVCGVGYGEGVIKVVGPLSANMKFDYANVIMPNPAMISNFKYRVTTQTTNGVDTIFVHYKFDSTLQKVCNTFFSFITFYCTSTGVKVYKTYALKIHATSSVRVNNRSLNYCINGDSVICRASGVDPGGTYSWYPTAGIVNANGVDSSWVALAPTTSRYYWVRAKTGIDSTQSCSVVDSVYVAVIPPFNYTITPTVASLCVSDTVKIKITPQISDTPYTYVWSEPFANSMYNSANNITSTSLQNPTIRAIGSGDYNVSITSRYGCRLKNKVTVNVTGLRMNIKANSDKSIMCPGDTTKLWTTVRPASVGISGFPILPTSTVYTTTPPSPSINYPTTYNPAIPSTAYPNPISTNGAGNSSITRVVYTKAQLLAMGASAGVIQSLSLNVSNPVNPILDEFFIKACGITTTNAVPANVGFLYTVYNPKSVTLTTGWNEYVFDYPLDWDGESNLLFEFHAFKTTSSLNPNTYSVLNLPGASSVTFKFSNTAGLRAEDMPGNFTPSGINSSIPLLKLKMARIDSSSTTFLNTTWLPTANVVQYANPLARGTGNQVDTMFTAITGTASCKSTSNVIVRPDNSFKVVGKGDTVVCLSSGPTSIPLSAIISSSGTPVISWTSIPPDPSMTVTNVANITVSPTKGSWKYIVKTSLPPCSAEDTIYVNVDDSIHIDLKIDSPKCTSNTGKLTAILPAASSPSKYNYSWSPNPSSSTNDTLKNIGAGIYTLSVTLKSNPLCGGSVKDTVVSNLINIPVNILSSGINCFGGTADSTYTIVNSPQSPGPFTYLWSNGGTSYKITNNVIGNYVVTVKDTITKCTGTSSYTLTQPPKLVVTASSKAVKCKGEKNGEVNSTVVGGTPNISYLWTSLSGINSNFNTSSGINLYADSFKLIVTDKFDCKDSTSIRVNEPANVLSVVMSGKNATTVGNNDGIVYATTSGGNPNYKYNWSNGTIQNTVPSTDSITGLVKGTYKLTVTDNEGCVTTGSQFIKDVDCGIKLFVKIDTIKCNGESTGKIIVGSTDTINSLNTSWYQFLISSSGPAFDSGKITQAYPTGTYTFSNLSERLYDIRVKTDKGCDEVFKGYSVPANLAMYVKTNTTDPSCKDYKDGAIYVSVFDDTFKPFTYMFDPAAGFITDSFSKTRSSGNNQTFKVKDALGCTKEILYNIGNPAGVTTSFVQTDSIACFGMTNAGGKVNVLPANPAKPYIYSYKPGTNKDTLSNLVQNVGAITDSVVIYYLCDTCTKKCKAVQTFTITEPAKLVLSNTKTDASCSYKHDGTITATTTGGNGTNNFSLNNFYTNTVFKPSQVSNVFDKLDSGTFKVYVTDKKGCIDSNKVTITRPDSFEVYLKVTDASCPEVSNGKVDIDLLKGGNPTGVYGYTWTKTNQGNQTSNAGAGASIPAAQGLNTYTLTVTDSKGCTASNKIFVDTLYTLQIVSAKIDSAKCFGSTDGSIEIKTMHPSTAPLPFTYAWSNGSGNVNPLNAGKGTYTVTVADGIGCKATGVYAIEQPADIFVQGKITHASCFSSSTGSVKINISGGHAPYVSQWATNPTQFTDSAVDLPAGSNSVVVTDAYGCVKNASFTITQPTTLVAKMVDVKNVTCNSAKNGSMAVSVTGGVYKYQYAWNIDTSKDSSIKNLGPNDNYKVTVTDNNGCTATASSPILEPLKLEFETIKVDSVSCPNYTDGSIDIYAQGGTISATKQYVYSIDGGYTYVVGNKFPNLPSGIYNVSVKDNNNCVAVRKIEVGSPEELSVKAKRLSRDTIKMGTSDTLYFTKSTNSGKIPTINSVLWAPNNGLACSDCETTQVTPFVTSAYSLEVRYHKNCLATSSIIVPILAPMDIFIPSAFSPGNQDLINDVLYVYGNGIKTVVFRVYDRWGEKVFESNSMKNGWDGTYKGNPAPVGVYSYQVQVEYLNGDKKNKQGSITLIR